jgi:hypothetical protein
MAGAARTAALWGAALLGPKKSWLQSRVPEAGTRRREGEPRYTPLDSGWDAATWVTFNVESGKGTQPPLTTVAAAARVATTTNTPNPPNHIFFPILVRYTDLPTFITLCPSLVCRVCKPHNLPTFSSRF